MELTSIIGKEVIAIKGFETDARKTKYIEPVYILFNDNETYIQFEEQDYYSYHDCAISARYIEIHKNSAIWKQVYENRYGNYPDANTDI